MEKVFIKTINLDSLKKSLSYGGCNGCGSSCQSACKTSCTVANQPCKNQKKTK